MQDNKNLSEQLRLTRDELTRVKDRERELAEQIARSVTGGKARLPGAPMDWDQLDAQSKIIFRQNEEIKAKECASCKLLLPCLLLVAWLSSLSSP